MTFKEIERLIDSDLPPSARKYRAWWSNNPSNSVCTYAWLEAGYRSSDVDLASGKLVFRKSKGTPPEPTANAPVMQDSPLREAAPKRHPIFGAMKGTILVEVDFDLTAPTGAEWGDGTENG